MSVSPDTQAILLLNAHFSKAKIESVKPLTPTEWGRFAVWLKEKSLRPEQLMTGRISEHLKGWADKKITQDRIERLMDRGSALALAMEKWQRTGLWVITRSDPDYPKQLKQRLRAGSPAILFGCGNKALLNTRSLAVIGSRNTTKSDLTYARNLGALAAAEGYSIVSGGAKGVDEASMLGALEVEGTAIGILANSLMTSCSSMKYRNYLMAKNLVLISSFYPDAGFNVGNAMQRNKYIYCLSDAALVVHSGTKGGTWSGAMENIRKQWVPLWVKQNTNDKLAGNTAIVQAGAAWAPEDIKDVDFKALVTTNSFTPDASEDLFNEVSVQEKEPELTYSTEPLSESKQNHDLVKEEQVQHDVTTDHSEKPVVEIDAGIPSSTQGEEMAFYDLFLLKIEAICSDTPKTTDELLDALDLNLNKTQLNTWLKKAVADKNLMKLSKPVRYQWETIKQSNLPL